MNKIKEIIVTILLLPPVLLLLLCFFILVTPVDYVKYKRSRYYKDTGEKYSWLCAMSSYIKLYDIIKNQKLPIDYYRCDDCFTGYGYFVYKDILILNDYEQPCFDAERNTWTVEIEDEYVDIKDEVADTIKSCNDFLKDDVCKRAAVLLDGDDYDQHPDIKYERFTVVPVYNNDIVSTLKIVMNL